MLELIERVADRHEVDVLSVARPTDDVDAAKQALRIRGVGIEVVMERSPSPLRLGWALMQGASFYVERHRSRAFAAALDRALATREYDLIQCEFPYTGQYRLGRSRTRAAWVLDAHNIEHHLSRRLGEIGDHTAYSVYARRETRARRRAEIAICRSMDAVVTVSAADRAALTSVVPGSDVVVVPNGVDVTRVTPGGDESARPGGLFVGKLDYRPNVDALRWFATSVLPAVRREIDDFELTVAGSGHPGGVASLHSMPGVTIVGQVDDVQPYLRSSWLVLVPIRAGSGTRLKILEALAAGKAVVTTTIGVEGLDALPGRDLLVADTPAAFAREVVRVCRDPLLRRRLGDAGRLLVESGYTWDRSVEMLDRLYHRLIEAAAVEVAAG